MRRLYGFVLGLMLTVSFVVVGKAHALPMYEAIGLGSDISVDFGSNINNSGQISGTSRGSVIWDNGVVTSLGIYGVRNQRTNGINDKAQVVGAYYTGTQYTAFLWDKGAKVDLPTLAGLNTLAGGINNNGQIIGSSRVGSDDHACLWDNGAIIDLGTLGGSYSKALGINDAGQVVGVSLVDSLYHAFLWENGSMVDLGTPGVHSNARAINENGQIVGVTQRPGERAHASLWENGTWNDLGTLGGDFSIGYDINNSGQVVGRSVDEFGNLLGFLWEGDMMLNLNDYIVDTFNGHLMGARAINDLGQILGVGVLDGVTQPILLNPIDDQGPVPTPEPSTFLLLGTGLLGIVAIGRKKYRTR